jgi:carbamoyltransferase
MNKVINFKNNLEKKVPAVSNIDKTGRLHTVNKKFNPKFYNLINNFYKKTNVPIILNTSFNNQEPIVETPEDAIKCFLSCDMDLLVLNEYLIKKLNS